MKGKTIAYAEETHLQDYARRTLPNAVIYGHPDLYILHLVRPEKTTWLWIIRSSFAGSRYYYRHLIMSSKANQDEISKSTEALKIVRNISNAFVRVTLGVWKRDRNVYPYMQNY